APQRALVLAAGSLVHLVLATIIVFGVLATVGNLNADGGLAVRTVNACVPVQETATTCTTGDLPSPARGVLQAGDHVLAVAGTPTPTFIAALTAIRARPDRPTQIVVERAGHRVSVELTPVPVVRGPLVGTGKPSRVGAIGVTTTQLTQHYSVLGAVPETFRVLGTFATGTWTVLHHLPSEVANLLAGRPRTGAGPASVIDIARISGDIAAAPGVPASQRLGTILLLIADLNFFIGLFNALPLLPLDGGHLAILGFEEGRRRLYGLVGRRDPGRVDLMKVMPVVYAFLAVFIGLSLLLLYAGVANPIRLQ
ncbi:MAG TPA: M50 family metallopeptidase, partial [Mycobacteriales bacterium]|nr:M50 family metallopeptidase [Mycobacteriales bacterium]